MRLTGGMFLIIALTLAACARRNDIARNADRPLQEPSTTSDNLRAQSTDGCVNLNTATVEQLMPLPGIGEVMSRKIIAHREQYGPFRRPEDLIIIEGFSEKQFRKIEDRVCVN